MVVLMPADPGTMGERQQGTTEHRLLPAGKDGNDVIRTGLMARFPNVSTCTVPLVLFKYTLATRASTGGHQCVQDKEHSTTEVPVLLVMHAHNRCLANPKSYACVRWCSRCPHPTSPHQHRRIQAILLPKLGQGKAWYTCLVLRMLLLNDTSLYKQRTARCDTYIAVGWQASRLLRDCTVANS